MLDDDDLREIDRILLGYLEEGSVTPVYCQQRIIAEDHRDEISRGYVQERLARFVEHDHAENLFDTGLYQLTDDPRADSDASGEPEELAELRRENEQLRDRIQELEAEQEPVSGPGIGPGVIDGIIADIRANVRPIDEASLEDALERLREETES